MLRAASLAVLLALTSTAAADDDAKAELSDDVVVSKKERLAPLKEAAGNPPGHDKWLAVYQANQGRELEPECYVAEAVVGLDPYFVHDARKGLHEIFLRDYKAARATFFKLGNDYPGWGIGPVGEVLVWQALMLENFDFRFEVQYQSALRKSQAELSTALQTPGNDAWEAFLMAGVLGIDSIHTMRHEEWMKALSRGYEAMKMVARVKELAPDFADIRLGDGLFNYWLSVVSRATKAMPDTPDNRVEGVADMRRVEAQGIFLSAPATLALTFTWLEERANGMALKSAMKNHKAYPDNVINNLVLGRVQMYNKQYAASEATLKQVQTVDPKNRRSHYYLARLYLRWKKTDQAIASLDKYLSFSGLDKRDIAVAHYYRGIAFARKQDWDAAEAAFKESWKVGKLERSKKRIAWVEKKRQAAAAGPPKPPGSGG